MANPRQAKNSPQANTLVILFLVLLIFAAILGGYAYYMSIQHQNQNTADSLGVIDPGGPTSDGSSKAPEESDTETANPDENPPPDNESTNMQLVCGLIDLAADQTLTLRQNDGTTWELLPEDGAATNTIRSREGVRTCIAYDATSEDQPPADLEDHKIHVVSAAMIRDAAEENL